MRQADRMKNAPLSKIRQIIDLADELERQGKPIIHMEIGEPDFDTPDYIIDSAKRALDKKRVHYGPVVGTADLRKAVCDMYEKKYHLSYVPGEVQVTHGVAHGLFLAMMAFLNPGDEILVPDPGYLCYFTIPNICGATAVSYVLDSENRYQINKDTFEGLITEKTKMILLNTPSNPCGFALDHESLEEIVRVAKKYDLLVVTDDVYADILYDGKKFTCIAEYPGMKERTIVLNGHSKYYAMTGWRVGYIVTDKSLIDPMMRLSFYSISCPNTFIQDAATTALVEDDLASRKMVEEYQERRDYLVDALNSLPGCKCQKPDGAFYVFMDIRGTGMSADEFCSYILEKEYVTMTPGHVFGSSGEGFVRVSYANSLENIKLAVERVRRALEKRGEKGHP